MMIRAGLIAAMISASPLPASAFELGGLWNPFKTPVEVLAQQADEARQRGELDLAQTLLARAERTQGADHPGLLRVRGLIARDRGRLGDAAEMLGRAADLDPTADSRVEQAAVLVPLGRWPESVEVLGHAFDERGASLRADDVLVDPRFAPLVGFAPFQDLIKRVRADQAGPLGRILLKFERIDDAVRGNREVLDVLGRWMQALGRIGAFGGTAVVVLLGLGLLCTFGIAQTGLVQPPATLVIGMTTASVLWYLAARIATGAADAGLVTIGPALGVVFVPWAAAAAGRWAWRRRAQRRVVDAFDAAHLGHTLALVDEVGRLGRELGRAGDKARPELVAELRRAAGPLAERLVGRELVVPEAQSGGRSASATEPEAQPGGRTGSATGAEARPGGHTGSATGAEARPGGHAGSATASGGGGARPAVGATVPDVPALDLPPYLGDEIPAAGGADTGASRASTGSAAAKPDPTLPAVPAVDGPKPPPRTTRRRSAARG